MRAGAILAAPAATLVGRRQLAASAASSAGTSGARCIATASRRHASSAARSPRPRPAAASARPRAMQQIARRQRLGPRERVERAPRIAPPPTRPASASDELDRLTVEVEMQVRDAAVVEQALAVRERATAVVVARGGRGDTTSEIGPEKRGPTSDATRHDASACRRAVRGRHRSSASQARSHSRIASKRRAPDLARRARAHRQDLPRAGRTGPAHQQQHARGLVRHRLGARGCACACATPRASVSTAIPWSGSPSSASMIADHAAVHQRELREPLRVAEVDAALERGARRQHPSLRVERVGDAALRLRLALAVARLARQRERLLVLGAADARRRPARSAGCRAGSGCARARAHAPPARALPPRRAPRGPRRRRW